MLGLADKRKVISLFKEVLSGNEKEALKNLNELINDNIEVAKNDFLIKLNQVIKGV